MITSGSQGPERRQERCDVPSACDLSEADSPGAGPGELFVFQTQVTSQLQCWVFVHRSLQNVY